MKSSAKKNGYPLDIDLSEDGENLVVSYLRIDGIKTTSRIAFYNFGDEGADKENQLVGGFDYSDTVIPRVSYMGKKKVVAVGDDRMIFFKAGKNPSKTKTVKYDQNIECLAISDKYIAMTMQYKSDDADEKHELRVYNKNGHRLVKRHFSEDYERIHIGKGEVIMVGSYKFGIYNLQGHRMLNWDSDQRILDISSTGKSRKYMISYGSTTDLVRVR